MDVKKSLSCVRPIVTPWTVACQALLSMEFSKQEYWNGLLCPPPGDLPNPGIKPRSPTLQVDSLPSEPPGTPTPSLQQLKKCQISEMFPGIGSSPLRKTG